MNKIKAVLASYVLLILLLIIFVHIYPSGYDWYLSNVNPTIAGSLAILFIFSIIILIFVLEDD